MVKGDSLERRRERNEGVVKPETKSDPAAFSHKFREPKSSLWFPQATETKGSLSFLSARIIWAQTAFLPTQRHPPLL